MDGAFFDGAYEASFLNRLEFQRFFSVAFGSHGFFLELAVADFPPRSVAEETTLRVPNPPPPFFFF